MKTPEFPFEIHPLSDEDGGGWLVTFPDLPGCMADGDSIEQAVVEAADAERAWLQANAKWGGKTPASGGRIIAQVPKELLASLEARASEEGVSTDHLVAGFISRGLAGNERGTA